MDKTTQVWIDLTHTLTPDIPSWDGQCGFKNEIVHDYHHGDGATKFRNTCLDMKAGMGTHIDAPVHCFKNKHTIAEIPLDQLLVPCVVIDVSNNLNADRQITLSEIQDFEKSFGKIQAGTFVIIRTGWDQFWDTPEKYRNQLLFPTVSAEVGRYLLTQDVAGIGVDTLSPDSQTDDFPIHRLFLSADKYIIENIAHSDKLPPVGAMLFALPIKIKDGTEAPARVIATYRAQASIQHVLTRAEACRLDQTATSQFGIPSIVLMENAGRNTVDYLLSLHIAGNIVICCGAGNNGGDGFVIARHLYNHDRSVTVLLFSDPALLPEAAKINYEILIKMNIPVFIVNELHFETYREHYLISADWIIDALLGTGLTRKVEGFFATVIDAINHSSAGVVAIDIPSGLDCDEGQPLGIAVKAHHTVSFVAAKKGFKNPDAAEYIGLLQLESIGIADKSLINFA